MAAFQCRAGLNDTSIDAAVAVVQQGRMQPGEGDAIAFAMYQGHPDGGPLAAVADIKHLPAVLLQFKYSDIAEAPVAELSAYGRQTGGDARHFVDAVTPNVAGSVFCATRKLAL